MGKVSKGVGCSVEGCNEQAEKSVSREKAVSAGLRVASGRGRAYLCKRHWKEYKRLTKKSRMIEKWAWFKHST